MKINTPRHTKLEKIDKIIIDASFFEDAPIRLLRAKYGIAGPYSLLRIYAELARCGGALKPHYLTLYIDENFTDIQIEAFIESLIDLDLLYYDEQKQLRSPKIDLDLLSIKKKRCAWKKRQTLSRKRKNVTRDTSVTHAGLTRESKDKHEHEPEPQKEPKSSGGVQGGNLAPKWGNEGSTINGNASNSNGKASRWHEKAETYLTPLTDDGSALWRQNPQFVNAGRRPMKKYNLIYLTTNELAEVFEEYASKLPAQEYSRGFKLCQAKLEQMRIEKQSLTRVSCYIWLKGWCLNEVLDHVTKNIRTAKAMEG